MFSSLLATAVGPVGSLGTGEGCRAGQRAAAIKGGACEGARVARGGGAERSKVARQSSSRLRRDILG